MSHVTMQGKCTCCRRHTAVILCKVEAFAGEARPVEAKLCDPCIDGFKVAKVTKMRIETPSELTEMYQ